MEKSDTEFIRDNLRKRQEFLRFAVKCIENEIIEKKGLVSNYYIDECKKNLKNNENDIDNIDKIIKKYFEKI